MDEQEVRLADSTVHTLSMTMHYNPLVIAW